MRPRHTLAAAAILTAAAGALDQLLVYAEPDAAGRPGRWHVRVAAATGQIADLALDDGTGWIGRGGLVARWVVDANGDGRDEGFVTSTGGAANDTYSIVTLAGCHLRQVRVAGDGPLRFPVGASMGMPKASTARASTGRAGACSRSGAWSGPPIAPTAARPTPGPGAATAGPPARWSARRAPPAAGSSPPRTTRRPPS